jgi:catechol 2,3-dioxygenase-like lactoylglutathione lyase family enzyme
MITGFAHICFIVKDLDESTRFYKDKLGFSQAFDFIDDKGKRFGTYLHIGGRQFFEMFIGEPTAPKEKSSYAHMCLEVDDINATVKDLRGKGLEVSDPKMGSDNSWQAWLKDPDGNAIELHHYTPKSKQMPFVK